MRIQILLIILTLRCTHDSSYLELFQIHDASNHSRRRSRSPLDSNQSTSRDHLNHSTSRNHTYRINRMEEVNESSHSLNNSSSHDHAYRSKEAGHRSRSPVKSNRFTSRGHFYQMNETQHNSCHQSSSPVNPNRFTNYRINEIEGGHHSRSPFKWSRFTSRNRTHRYGETDENFRSRSPINSNGSTSRVRTNQPNKTEEGHRSRSPINSNGSASRVRTNQPNKTEEGHRSRSQIYPNSTTSRDHTHRSRKTEVSPTRRNTSGDKPYRNKDTDDSRHSGSSNNANPSTSRDRTHRIKENGKSSHVYQNGVVERNCDSLGASNDESIDHHGSCGDNDSVSEGTIFLSNAHSRILLSTEVGYNFLNAAYETYRLKLRIEWEKNSHVMSIAGTKDDQKQFNGDLMAFIEGAIGNRVIGSNFPRKKHRIIETIQEHFRLLNELSGNVDKLYDIMQVHEHYKTKKDKKIANRVRKELNMILMGQAGLRDGRVHMAGLERNLNMLMLPNFDITLNFLEECEHHFNYIFSSYRHLNYPALIAEYKMMKFREREENVPSRNFYLDGKRLESKICVFQPIEGAQYENLATSSANEKESTKSSEESSKCPSTVKE